MNARTPPHSIDAEYTVLGGLMLSSARGETLAADVRLILRADDFYREDHRIIYEAICQLDNDKQPHDFHAVMQSIEDTQIKVVVEEIGHGVVTYLSTAYYAGIVKAKAKRRQIIAACNDAMQEVMESDEAAQSVAILSKRLDEILASGIANSAVSSSEAVALSLEDYDRACVERAAGRTPGIPFGMHELDSVTGGMRAGELIGIAARTSIGKTAFAVQAATSAALNGYHGIYITLEETPSAIIMRAAGSCAGVNIAKVRSGDPEISSAYNDAIIKHGLAKMPLWIDSRTFDLQAISSRIAQYVRRNNIKFAVVDHIGLVNVKAAKNQQRYEVVGEVTRTLKQLAEQMNIAIVAVIQVGRDSEKSNRPPRLSDLRESGNIEQDLNVCIALHPEEDKTLPLGDVKINVSLLKNRYGPKGNLPSPVIFHGQTQQFQQCGY